MQPIELILKIWGIEDANRAEVEKILATSDPKYIGHLLASLAASADDAFAEANHTWMRTFLPELHQG